MEYQRVQYEDAWEEEEEFWRVKCHLPFLIA